MGSRLARLASWVNQRASIRPNVKWKTPPGGRGFYLQRPDGLLGPKFDPLGDELIMPLPEGLLVLFAPPVALPAPPDTPDPVLPLWPVVAPLPAVAPLEVDPPLAAPAPVEPPLWAKATLLVSASAAANPNVASFISVSVSLMIRRQTEADGFVPASQECARQPSLTSPRKTRADLPSRSSRAGQNGTSPSSLSLPLKLRRTYFA
jgi:hypothetical protein